MNQNGSDTTRLISNLESAVSSNRIEGIEIERRRVGAVIFGKPPLRDRNEEEIRGYRDALRKIHEKSDDLTIPMKTVFDLHRLCRSGTGDAGKLKEKKAILLRNTQTGESGSDSRPFPQNRQSLPWRK